MNGWSDLKKVTVFGRQRATRQSALLQRGFFNCLTLDLLARNCTRSVCALEKLGVALNRQLGRLRNERTDMDYHTFTRRCDGMCDSCDCDESVRLPDRQRGLYGKFTVARTDGSSEPGGKHENCEYFVLDLTHDKHASVALQAYASSCAAEFPVLAANLLHKLAPTEAANVLPGATYMDPPDGGSVTVGEQLRRMSEDAARFRWLTEDHAHQETRAKCRELLGRLGVMSYASACADIDAAMEEADDLRRADNRAWLLGA